MRVPPIATARRGLLRDYGFVFAVIAVVTLLGKLVSGVGDRVTHNRVGMEETLRNLGAAAED